MATPIGNIAIDTTEKVLNIGVDFYGYDIVAVKPDVACQISVNDNAHYQNYDANELVNIPGPINRLYVKTASGTGTLRHWAYRGITPVNSINAVKMTDDMDLLNSELADIPNHANASQELKILNPYGTTQNIHPKVLYFQTAWHGYKWWMAYTPYTYSALAQENPCIAVSNDGINWTVPAGLTNPLEPYPGVSSKYNSDTHLVYRSDLDRLEIWWRYVDDTAHTTMLKRKTSLDGVTWDVNENIFAGDTSANDHMSPSVIFENGKYKMWCITNNPLKVKYYESATGLDGSWSFGIDVPISLGIVKLIKSVLKT
jgi:hypothetical protein